MAVSTHPKLASPRTRTNVVYRAAPVANENFLAARATHLGIVMANVRIIVLKADASAAWVTVLAPMALSVLAYGAHRGLPRLHARLGAELPNLSAHLIGDARNNSGRASHRGCRSKRRTARSRLRISSAPLSQPAFPTSAVSKPRSAYRTCTGRRSAQAIAAWRSYNNSSRR